MRKYIAIFATALCATNFAYAQNDGNIYLPTFAGDGLRFSQTNYGSSARFKGMGNAQMSVGGDISALSGNPAGLGFFTKSEFVFTPEFNGTNANTNYLGNKTTANKGQVNLSQIGAVFYMPSYRTNSSDTKKGVVSGVIGIGYSRNSDYGLQADYSGLNTSSSVYNMFDDNFSFPANNKQSGSMVRTGGVSEFNVAGALNISNQVYLGASVGLINLNYNNDISLFEDAAVQPGYAIDYFQNQMTKGSGVNARLGVIFKPVNDFRIGVNLQTPTWFTVDDSMVVSSSDANELTSATYDNTYNLRTPMKASIGASYILGGRGMLTADVDFVDYASMHFSSTNGGKNAAMIENNQEIKANYKSAVNYRIGGEIKVDNAFSLRAGYGLNGSAYKDDTSNLFDTQFYSGGIGYRNKNYYLDLAYQHVATQTTFSPYLLSDFSEPVAAVKNNKNNVFLTFGVRF